ncbi:MAG: 1-acyl-sn-glycerol-3-phosphate acyltransferase [Gammaproteobacteria bacterium]|nr:1-acyl-sn-glycerol-3-phosphate acyltransferase [Gammaproteobacteria bacterium]
MTIPGEKSGRGDGHGRRRFGARLYGIYAHAVFWGTALLVLLVILILPGAGLRWRLMRRALGFMAGITGIRVRVRGLDHLPAPGRRCLLVANHASYLDSPLLILALPHRFSFVAKAELRANPLVHLFLRLVGTEFIERRNARVAARDLRALSELSRRGRALLFFPEGTLRRAPGLLPFRMGAFSTAVDEDIPVVPIAIDGSRALLADGERWPHRGEVIVTIGRPLHPRDFAATGADKRRTAQNLRDGARAAIAEQCGEAPVAAHTGRDGPAVR